MTEAEGSDALGNCNVRITTASEAKIADRRRDRDIHIIERDDKGKRGVDKSEGESRHLT